MSDLKAAVAIANALEENDHCGDGWAILNHLGFERREHMCGLEESELEYQDRISACDNCRGIGAIASQTIDEKRST